MTATMVYGVSRRTFIVFGHSFATTHLMRDIELYRSRQRNVMLKWTIVCDLY